MIPFKTNHSKTNTSLSALFSDEYHCQSQNTKFVTLIRVINRNIFNVLFRRNTVFQIYTVYVNAKSR